MIVQAARTSLTVDETMKSKKADDGLLHYLFKNRHTSPFEMRSATLSLMRPLAIVGKFWRHQIGKCNQFSQQYADVNDELGNYNPPESVNGI